MRWEGSCLILRGRGQRNEGLSASLHYLPWPFVLQDKATWTPTRACCTGSRSYYFKEKNSVYKGRLLWIFITILTLLVKNTSSYKYYKFRFIHTTGYNMAVVWGFCRFTVIWVCPLCVNKTSPHLGQLSHDCMLSFMKTSGTCTEENWSPRSENQLETHILCLKYT